MNLDKVYDCLVTGLNLAMERTATNDLTYAYHSVGHRILRYVYNKSLNPKGCLFSEGEDDSEVSFMDHELIKQYNNITSLIKHYCSSKSLEIMNLIQGEVFNTTAVYHKGWDSLLSFQSLILNGSSIIVKDNKTHILDDYYPGYQRDGEYAIPSKGYTLTNNIFEYDEGVISFYGFNGEDCKAKNVLNFLQKINSDQILTSLYDNSVELISEIQNTTTLFNNSSDHGNLTNQYTSNYNVENPYTNLINIVIGLIAGIICCGVAYTAYRLYGNFYDKGNDEPVNEDIAIYNIEQDVEISGMYITDSNEIG